MRIYANVSYVTGSANIRQQLDLKLPNAGDGSFPLVIFIHGGGFAGGSKEDINETAFYNAPDRGYAVASVNYRLSTNNAKAFPESVEDVLAAVRHLRANSAEYRLDPKRFAVSGFSAGGYLAAMACVLSSAKHDFDNPVLGNAGVSSAVKAAVCMAGLSDFMQLNDHQSKLGGSWMASDHFSPGSILWQYFGGNPLDSAFMVNTEKSNPLNYVNENTPPILMFHGSNDGVVPWLQSKVLADKINESIPGRAEFALVADGEHCPAFPNTEDRIFRFLNDKFNVQS